MTFALKPATEFASGRLSQANEGLAFETISFETMTTTTTKPLITEPEATTRRRMRSAQSLLYEPTAII